MTPRLYVGLYAALRNLPDLSRGLCKGDDPRTWDAVSGPDVERNKAICSQCVEQTKCHAWAKTQPRSTLIGVVGGVLYGEPKPTTKESKTA